MADPRPWTHPDLLVAVGVASVVAVSVRTGHGAAAWRRAGDTDPRCRPVARRLDGPRIANAAHRRHACTCGGVRLGGPRQEPVRITFENIYRADEGFYASGMRAGARVLFGLSLPAPQPGCLPGRATPLLGDLRYSEVAALALAVALMVWMRSAEGLLCAGALAPGASTRLSHRTGMDGAISDRLDGAHRGHGTSASSTGVAAVGPADRVEAAHGARPGVRSDARGRRRASRYATDRDPPGSGLVPSALRTWNGAWAVATFMLKAIGVAAVVTLPLAVLDIPAFIKSAVLLQLREPFRLDSLSFTRELLLFGVPLEKQGAMAVSLSAGVVGLVLAWWRAPRTPAGFAASLGTTCFLLTAFGKKAFLNYYFMVVAFLLIAIAASGQRASLSATPAAEPPAPRD